MVQELEETLEEEWAARSGQQAAALAPLQWYRERAETQPDALAQTTAALEGKQQECKQLGCGVEALQQEVAESDLLLTATLSRQQRYAKLRNELKQQLREVQQQLAVQSSESKQRVRQLESTVAQQAAASTVQLKSANQALSEAAAAQAELEAASERQQRSRRPHS